MWWAFYLGGLTASLAGAWHVRQAGRSGALQTGILIAALAWPLVVVWSLVSPNASTGKDITS